MGRMELKAGADVFSSDGKLTGKVNCFVLMPATREVTHIVVRKGRFFSEDKLVPFNVVYSAGGDKVLLSQNMDDFDQMLPFEETHVIRAGETDSSRDRYLTVRLEQQPLIEKKRRAEMMDVDVSRGGTSRVGGILAYYWHAPHGYVGYPVTFYSCPPIVTTRNIPKHTVPLKVGTDVIGSDGQHAGQIECLFVATASNTATHFIVAHGLLFKQRKFIPAHWIKTFEENTVKLTVSSNWLKGLPAYDVPPTR